MKTRTNSQDWRIDRAVTTRGAGIALKGIPAEFLPEDAKTEEFIATPQAPSRGAAAAGGALDISVDLAPGELAVLAVRQPSGALTFHAPKVATSRSRGGPGEARFIVPLRPEIERSASSRGIVGKAVKAIVVKLTGPLVDAALGFALPKLALAFETAFWKRRGLREGWLKVTKEGLANRRLLAGKPSSRERSLLLVHGTFSNAAAAFGSLAGSSFFEDVKPIYGDRIFAFDHFSLSRTPEENVRMLLSSLPDDTFTFDVITHSRGGLVLRNLVERPAAFGSLSDRFTLGHAVLVASPNEGTPLATPARWEQTVGWVANLLELFPDNPFTTGAEFVANGLVWIAKHASGDLPGLHSMDGDGDLVRELQSPPGPPADRYSALVANYHPGESVLKRLIDIGFDQFFNSANDLVVPSEGGWRIDPSGGSFIPGARIGCFGPGGNLPGSDVNHVNFFSRPEAVAFLTAALQNVPNKLSAIDPAASLPDRRLARSGAPGISAPATTESGQPAPALRARRHGRGAAPAAASPGHSISLVVVNGDLSFEARPLLVGHYRASRLTGTEQLIDGVLGQAMSHSLSRGVYPVEPGSNRIFINRDVQPGKFWLTPRPKAAIVAGLGQEGRLQSADVVRSVRQAVIAWSEHSAASRKPPKALSLSTTLLASGGTGITPGQSAQLIAQGVHEANELLRRSAPEEQLPEVRELRFVELYLNRATEAWEALKMLAHASPARYSVVEPIATGIGALRRPLESGYRGADYDFITAETRKDVDGNPFIAYALNTKRARTEVRAQKMQGRLLRDLVASASSEATNDDQISRTLYNLLVPIELEAFLANAGETQIEVDEGTADIPWELLNDAPPGSAPRPPWAIRSKLLRKFKTENYRAQVNDADTEASILVIAEPECPPNYPPLPGALAEAKDVVRLIKSDSRFDADSVTALFSGGEVQSQPDSRQVVDALFRRDWRVIHVAGHGEAVSDNGRRGGVVLSNGTFLGANEIEAMRVVPELVFVNCCHLAQGGPRAFLRDPQPASYSRAAFASGVAQSLIRIGVRCVVAAGWAVNDTAARVFATTFYEALLRGERFIDAVGLARRKTFEFDGNTWAAYQCYGDPDWRWKLPGNAHAVPKAAAVGRENEFDRIGSPNALRLALDTLFVQSTYQKYPQADQLDRLRLLEERSARMAWRGADVAEQFARAFAAAGDLRSAIRWYEAAAKDAQGKVSLRIFEQLSNLRVRVALQGVKEAGASPREAKSRTVRLATEHARATIKAEMERLEQLIAFQETSERQSLRGSAMKRLAMLERDAKRAKAAGQAIKAMAGCYRRAVELAVEEGADNLFYPAINLLAAELALPPTAPAQFPKGLSAPLFEQALKSVQAKNDQDPDFWSRVAEPELALYQALAKGDLATHSASILSAFRQVWGLSRGGAEWGSVIDTLEFVTDPYQERVSEKAGKAARLFVEELKQLVKPEARKVRT